MAKLTNQQQKVIALILKGKSNQEIADQLKIQVGTVKSHTYRAFGKMKIKNRVNLIIKGDQYVKSFCVVD